MRKIPLKHRVSAGALFVAFGFWSTNADVLIDLDATGLAEGALPSITNNGSLGGTFDAEVDTPSVTSVGGVNAITLDGTNDWYVGPDATALSGSADRSCEAWVYNPGDIPDEETIIAWGRRGGGGGQNWSMLYGDHPTFGALGGWGAAADMPFQPGGGAPPSDQWNHLVLTYDGVTNTRSIYVDGLLSNSEDDGGLLNTHADDNTGQPLPFTLGNQNEANGTRADALSGALSIAKIKIHDTALDAAAVRASFEVDKADFGKLAPQIVSFTASSNTFEAGETVTLFFDAVDEDTLSIDNGVGDVTGLTQIDVMPAATTTYTLSATNAEGSKTEELTVFLVEAASLIHQWTFDEIGGAGTTLVDSIGDADGTIVDNGNLDGSVGQGKVTLTGGAKDAADYIQFPSGLLEGLAAVTVETWAATHSVQNWSRVFSFGSGTGNVANTYQMAWSRGTAQNTQRYEMEAVPTNRQADSDLPVEFDRTYHIVATWNPGGGLDGMGRYEWFRDGVFVEGRDTLGIQLSQVDDSVLWLGRSQWGDNTANASWEEFRIYNGVLTQAQIDANLAAGPTVPGDSDSDGIPDVIENQYAFLNPNDPADAALDQDDDGLDNVGEVMAGTDLEVKDTDMDGSEDGPEVAANTDPLNPDSDGDGLLDGVETGTGDFVSETDTGTDPLDPDTDGDLAGDGLEVDRGSDPTNPLSLPAPPKLIHRWAFDENGGSGTVLVDSVGGADGTIEEVGANDGTVAEGKVTLTGGPKDASDFVRLPANLMSVLTDATIETWVTQHSAQNWSRVFSYGSATNNVMHMAFSRGADINLNEIRWNLTGNAAANITLQDFGNDPQPNPLDQQVHWVVTIDGDDGPADTRIAVYKNGDLVTGGETPNKLSQTVDTDFFLGRSQWGDNTANASWDEFRIYDQVMDPSNVKASFDRGPDAAPGIRFEITDVSYDSTAKTMDVTWSSAPGAFYVVWASEDGIDWSDLDDAFPSEGDSTTYPDIDASGERLLIRIERTTN